MNFPFNRHRGLIVVRAELTGPLGSAALRLALDTGATCTLIRVATLLAVGYDPAITSDRVPVTTASGVASALRVSVTGFATLGQERTDFPVLCHTLPPGAGVDGLLGLDFFRGHTLTLDFRVGRIELE